MFILKIINTSGENQCLLFLDDEEISKPSGYFHSNRIDQYLKKEEDFNKTERERRT